MDLSEIIENVRGKISVQQYGKKPAIEGVKVIELKKSVGEDGTFEELARIGENGCLEALPEFKPRQVSRSRLLPKAVKAWHLHFNQEDVWYVAPEDHMMLGLWDLRESSGTKDAKVKITLGGGKSCLVLIPRGVAHGVANVGPRPGTIVYFVNQQFNPADPDERRLAWDAAGADFWEPKRE